MAGPGKTGAAGPSNATTGQLERGKRRPGRGTGRQQPWADGSVSAMTSPRRMPFRVQHEHRASATGRSRIPAVRVPCDRRTVTVGNEAPIWRSQNPAHDGIGATCRLKPARACSLAADTFARACSSACSRDAMDQGSGARRQETPRLPVQDSCRTTWTSGTIVDDGRLTHNPEVEGSNPAPATKARGPFSNRERASCMWFLHGMARAIALFDTEDAYALRFRPVSPSFELEVR
jgi:hypothetical protein